jgi:hypothetical protein
MSVRPHGTTRLRLDGFSWNLVFQYLLKICRENTGFIENLTRILGFDWTDFLWNLVFQYLLKICRENSGLITNLTRMLGYDWTDFHEIWYFSIENLPRKFKFYWKSDKNTRLPLDGFSWNLVFQYLLKICRENTGFIENLTRILGFDWRDFYENWYFSIYWKSAEKIQV